ncbi:MAG: LysR substrate-binding domain-containing protein [Stenotrophobium sp.]
MRAFEAVARLRSFRKASDELFVTPAAVTHQIKALEEQLGISLFARFSHGVELTPAAEAALPRLQQGFEMVGQAVRDLRDFGQSPRLTISVTTTLASRWLVPRLERFLSKHPGVDVRILASNRQAEPFERKHQEATHAELMQTPDIEIHFSQGPPAGDIVDPLFSVHVVPMCHPRLVKASPPMLVPDDLRHRTLLHGDSRLTDRSQSTWAKWLKLAGATMVDPRRGLQLDHSTLALEAAADGLGVTLAMPMLAAQELSEGKVCIVFPIALSLAKAYFIVTSTAAIQRPEVSAFRVWLLEEAQLDAAMILAKVGAARSVGVKSSKNAGGFTAQGANAEKLMPPPKKRAAKRRPE